MSAGNTANTHEVIGEIFRAMNTEPKAREKAKIPRWAGRTPLCEWRTLLAID